MRDDYLYELRHHGCIRSRTYDENEAACQAGMLLGELAQLWKKKRESDIRQKQLKSSSWRDYRSIMNHHILPYFGNMVITEITVADIEDFISTLECSAKRINNILIPLRSLFKMAKRRGLVQTNIMIEIENLKTEQPDIFPLSREEVEAFLQNVHPHYHPFFTVAFTTGMRFGEMAALKWENVDFEEGRFTSRSQGYMARRGLQRQKSPSGLLTCWSLHTRPCNNSV